MQKENNENVLNQILMYLKTGHIYSLLKKCSYCQLFERKDREKKRGIDTQKKENIALYSFSLKVQVYLQ